MPLIGSRGAGSIKAFGLTSGGFSGILANGGTVTEYGILIKSTSGKNEGITPRWFEVFEVGPDIDWLKPGQWVYVEYGRWSESLKLEDERWEGKQEVWRVDPKGCLAVSDEKPENTLYYNKDTAFDGSYGT